MRSSHEDHALSSISTITWLEWRRVRLISISLVAITCVPYLLGVLMTSPDRQFGGLLIGLEDQYSYVAKMVQGGHGAWLVHLPYTATPHPGIFLYTFYLLLGKLSIALNVPHIIMYHTARAVLGFVMLLVMYRFIAEFVASRPVRLIAWLFAVMAGGPGWIALLSGQPTVLDSLPLEFILPEGFTFLMLYTLPHLLLARTLLLLGALGVWRAGQNRSIRLMLAAGVAWATMSIIQPIYSAVVLMIAGVMIAARSIAVRHVAWRQIASGSIAGVWAMPMVIYVLTVFAVDPTYRLWSQTAITSPGLLLYAITYGVPLVLAIGGLAYVVQRHNAGLWFLALWTVITPLMVYAPTNAQRRLIESWQIPLSVMAAIGLVGYVLPGLRRIWRRLHIQLISLRRVRRIVTVGIMLALIPTYVIMIGYHVTAVLMRWPPLFQDASLVGATAWLDQHATYADGVLAAYSTSTIIPARSGVRVLLGHPSETIDVAARKADVEKFFQAETTDTWRRELLAQFQLDYVYYGSEERNLGSFNPSQAVYLEPVLKLSDAVLYQVEAVP